MEKYRRVRKARTEETEAKENEIRVSATQPKGAYITTAIQLLKGGVHRSIVLKGMGVVIYKTITIAELVKRRVLGLYQLNEIISLQVEDEYVPLEQGLQPKKISRVVSTMSITLSLDPLDSSLPGYQPPLPESEVNEAAAGVSGEGVGYQAKTDDDQDETANTSSASPNTRGRGRGSGRGRGRGSGRGSGRGNGRGYNPDRTDPPIQEQETRNAPRTQPPAAAQKQGTERQPSVGPTTIAIHVQQPSLSSRSAPHQQEGAAATREVIIRGRGRGRGQGRGFGRGGYHSGYDHYSNYSSYGGYGHQDRSQGPLAGPTNEEVREQSGGYRGRGYSGERGRGSYRGSYRGSRGRGYGPRAGGYSSYQDDGYREYNSYDSYGGDAGQGRGRGSYRGGRGYVRGRGSSRGYSQDYNRANQA